MTALSGRKILVTAACLLVLWCLSVPVAARTSANKPADELELAHTRGLLALQGGRYERLVRAAGVNDNHLSSNFSTMLQIRVTAIYIEQAEFPMSKLLFRLTLKLALQSVEQRLKAIRVKLLLSVRSANTCSRQFAGAIAAEEYYTKKARLFIVSGCDDAIRGVSRLASKWQVPVLTAAGFGADLNDKTIYRSLIRVAFSLRTAVEFLGKILNLFSWQRVNLIVDESDPNSLALKESIEKQLVDSGRRRTVAENLHYQLRLNVISLDLQLLISSQSTNNSTQEQLNSQQITSPVVVGSRNNSSNIGNNDDKWPNELTAKAVRDALRQSSLSSRVNILLIPQNYLRKFMLTVYDLNMANGLYTFINMPLLLVTSSDGQLDNTAASSSSNYSRQTYSTSAGENVFVWRSMISARNSQAKQAFESLMSIFLKTPTTKAYLYFANRLSNLANTDYATTTTTQSSLFSSNSRRISKETNGIARNAQKVQLNINPYSASFYDCIQIYSIALNESLASMERENRLKSGADAKRRPISLADVHSRISQSLANRRFDNMVTGTILINENGDRESDYTLDDLNKMTGKFVPAILFKGDTKEIERLGKIHWSSNESVGPTIDNVECHLTGTCTRKPYSKFFVTLMLMAAPLLIVMGFVMFCVYKHISLESQLVDYWWRINSKDIEMITSRRKNAGDRGSSVNTKMGSSLASSHAASIKARQTVVSEHTGIQTRPGSDAAENSVTKGTDTSVAFATSAADVCYGNISLGVYKLAKVALKPISKLPQTRKLMIELRTIKGINHNNLCRFVGIVVDEPNLALVYEFCPKGSLREFFQNESMVIDWTFKYSIMNDIIAGLLYLHSSPIEFHGRLKSSNCLVSSRFIVKLSDYGLSSLRTQLDEEEIDEELLMRRQLWRAPEHMKFGANKGASKKGDVYSFGLLLYEIITNNLPFYNMDKNEFIIPLKQLYQELRTNGPSDKVGPDLSAIDTGQENIETLVSLMQQCWQFDPVRRPSSPVLGAAFKKITHGVTSKKLLENLTSRMEQYTNNLESLIDAKLATLLEEKQKTEELVYQFVPKSIASLLKQNQSVEPEAFECVTVFYSDIVGFTSLSSESSPMEVIDFLSSLYLCFDETLEQYDIFKVDTIGDAYIVASGLPQRNDGKHVIEIARAALELRQRLANFKIPHKPGRSLQMRVGIHSGPCIAGIVGGLNMPKYCVFGDTLTIGKFMESSGLPMKIHITEESKNLLQDIPGFKVEPRVPKISRDGLPFQTYWLDE